MTYVGRSRNQPTKCWGCEWDHVIEWQLVKAAINLLKKDQYAKEKLEALVEFFNEEGNIQPLRQKENKEKGAAVTKFIKKRLRGSVESPNDREKRWITQIRRKWSVLKGRLHGFELFSSKLDYILKQ